MRMTPAIAELLPELDSFVDELADDIAHVEHDEFLRRCRTFYSDGRVTAIDDVVDGWATMASFGDGVTLWHTTAAMASLRRLDEYSVAGPPTRNLMDWAVLLHDIGKQPDGRDRDHMHAFRSAALAGRVLPDIGFETTEAWSAGFGAWSSLTVSASRHDTEHDELVQDNHRLTAILDGANRLYGPDGAVVLTAIALHLSVTVVADWPARTPLTSAEERRFIDPSSTSVLLATMLADHGGWNTFDRPMLRRYLAETRACFERF